MSSGPTARTRLVALLGDPVAHSLSPVFQNAAFRASAVDGVYLALRCDPQALPGLLRGIAAGGGAGNVTLPHKELAARVVDRLLPAAERTSACNTFWCEAGTLWGDNTDVAGVSRAVSELLGGPLAGARVLLLGAGGAARAAFAALQDDGADRIDLLNRSADRARALRDAFGPGGGRGEVFGSASSLRGERFDLVVNATSLGLLPDDPLPLDPDHGVHAAAVLDLVYAPGRTRWVRAWRAAGVPAEDGISMLVHQGALAFERWWGRTAPVHAMRDALTNPSEDELSEPAAPAG